MIAATLERDVFMPRRPAGLGSGLVLAVIAHLLLVAGLTFSVNWRVSTPEGVEAELWAAVPQIAAPRAAEPEPPPPPERVVKAQPAPEPVKPPPKEQALPDAQIAIEKAKRLEDKRKKDLAEQAREDKEAKKEAEKLAKQRKAEQLEKQAEKLTEQKRKDADAAKKRADAAEAVLAAEREKQMQRIAGLAGATGAPSSTGTAAQSAGPSADYIGRIKGRIRPNVSFPDTLPGNPAVEIEIRLAPDGRIMSSRIVKRSGAPEWDDAVLRAIDKTAVLPRDENGRIEPAMTIVYRPRD